MPDVLLQNLVKDLDRTRDSIQQIQTLAVDQNRELTQQDRDLLVRHNDRVADLSGQIEILTQQADLSDQAQARLNRMRGGVDSAAPVEYRSAAEYLSDFVNAEIADDPTRRVAARHRLDTYNRAAAHVTTDAFTGLFPQAVVGPLINLIDTSRPFISLIGARGIPGGPSFRRPVLTDAHLADGVGVQAAQKDELVSQQFKIDSKNVDLVTLGGYVNVARQIFDWGVASLQLVVDQLAVRYGYATERAALAEMQKSTGKVTLAADATAAATIKAFYDAAAAYYTATAELPTVVVAGPKGWARLGALSDAAGRQILPFLAPANAAGTMGANSFSGNPVGLRLAVTPAITDDEFWVLGPRALEVYEQTVGQLSVVEPSVLGVQVSYSGYVGFFRPAENGAIKVGA